MTDMVERPNHYVANGVEAIEVIQAWCLGYELGCAVKYILRAGRKSKATEIEDLRKACRYLRFTLSARGYLFTRTATRVDPRLQPPAVAEAFGLNERKAKALGWICQVYPGADEVERSLAELSAEIERLEEARQEAA